MEHGVLFYILFGASVVGVPAIADRLLKDRVPEWARIALGLLVAALTGLIFVLERIPVTFEHSPRAERSSCILVG